MEVILRRKTHLPQERCTSLFANCSTFLFAKKRTLLFAVYKGSYCGKCLFPNTLLRCRIIESTKTFWPNWWCFAYSDERTRFSNLYQKKTVL